MSSVSQSSSRRLSGHRPGTGRLLAFGSKGLAVGGHDALQSSWAWGSFVPWKKLFGSFLCCGGFWKGTAASAGGPRLQRRRDAFGHPTVAWRLLLHSGHRQQAPQIHPKISQWHGRPPSLWFRCCRVWQPRNSIPRRGSLSLKYPLSEALTYLQSSLA